jgi:hypothetical protein
MMALSAGKRVFMIMTPEEQEDRIFVAQTLTGIHQATAAQALFDTIHVIAEAGAA